MQIKQSIGVDSTVARDAFAVRYHVFVTEQGFSPESEIDEYDNQALHLVGYQDGQPIAVARVILPLASACSPSTGMKAKIGRFALLADFRQLGLGRQLMAAIKAAMPPFQVTELSLSAQLPAKEFYLRLGFKPQGEIFLEEGVEHITMVHSLIDSNQSHPCS